MAFENNQQEPGLPGGDKNYRRKTANHLPKYFRTEFNNKFLSSTLDQMMQPGVAEKLNVFYGRKQAIAFDAKDNYVGDVNKERENYQLEPATIIKDNLGNVNFYADYNDYINKLKILSTNTDNHSDVNSQEYYSWNPNIDWDKFVNFREYYWLPTGPVTISVFGQTKEVQSTYSIEIKDNAGDPTYLFSPDGLTNNPTLTLYKGQTYRFSVNTPNYPISFVTSISFTPGRLPDQETTNTSLIYSNGITKYNLDGTISNDIWIDEGIIEFTVPDNAPEFIYYISKDDPNLSGLIRINDITENTEINVDNEIIGKQTYTTSTGVDLSNGMKCRFLGNVTPEKYASGEWYVEGVGDKIQLIKQEDLEVSGLFTDDITVEFDNQEFDYYPFSEALGFPSSKDYIVINRASKDGNLWSRYNRWFHRSVIEKSAEVNGQIANIDQASRASRPIIEFEKGLKLNNFGTFSKPNVNLIDTFTVDAFSYVEGAEGYNIDGINLTEGMRVLFTNDPDPLVKGRIFKVNFVKINNKTQISLIEESDTVPQLNETVLITQGNLNRGKYFYYDGTVWKEGQSKTSVNQQPKFDLFDDNDFSFGDKSKYESSLFAGNNIFSYTRGSGTNDPELGFPLTYRSIENSGDIVFNFNLLNESFTYTLNNALKSKNTDTGFLRKYSDRTNYTLQNGWSKASKDSTQNVVRQYTATANQSKFALDMYSDTSFVNSLWIRVFVNNKLKIKDVDFSITQDPNNESSVEFVQALSKDDVVIIKTRSNVPKNRNGFYELADNLEKNPLNKNINQFTLGEVNDHLRTIVEESDVFTGNFPGASNLRDIGNLSTLGKKFLKHSSPINLSLYHILDETSNVAKALSSARYDYGKFKRLFLETADTLGFDGPVRLHVDRILEELVKDKTNSMPYYFSDMVPLGGNKINSIEIEDADQQFFALSSIFQLDAPSTKAVQIYHNGLQLVEGKDYTFNSEGFAVVTATKQVGDIIEIIEYENTNGSYVPPTPTKLGLYPKFQPEIYTDDTVQNTAPDNPSGAYKFYGVAGPNQNGAGKLGWFYPLYATLSEAQARDTELGGTGQAHLHTFVGLQRQFYMPNTGSGHGLQDTQDYDEWVEGSPVIQGHDGSKVTAYKDYRDNLLLDLERRIYNNLKVQYDPTVFDIHEISKGLYRNNGIKKTDLDNSMISEFLSWLRLVDLEYTKHNYFNRQNQFTFNYRNTRYANTTEDCPGWWRQVYINAYDTDRPHTHPWEMLGFTIKPTWWETQYGSAPYTSNNLPLWEDLEAGIIRQPTFKIDKKYLRPGLINNIPVDAEGKLLSPNDSRLSLNLNILDADNSFTFGDGGPVETAWRRSSEYPFALIRSFVINRPSKTFATGFDRIRQKRNLADQIVYGDTGKQIILENIVYPTSIDDDTQVFTSGLINYIFDYQTALSRDNLSKYKENLSNIRNQIGFKIGGFTDKNKFKLILDSRTPLNQGNVFVPDENYSIFLNSSFPTKEVTYSGIIVEKQVEGYYIKGYDNTNPVLNYFPPIPKANDPLINVGGVSEPFVTWAENKTYVSGSVVKSGSSFYRTKETHTSTTSFDASFFVQIPSLPTVGGRDAFLRKDFAQELQRINYGHLYENIQDVVDFLLGYGRYLESLGFTFSQFREESYDVLDWQTSVREFLYWTTQNWGAGTVLTLSPGADKINFTSNFETPSNVLETFFGYSILKADGKILPSTSLKFAKDNDNNFSVRTIDTEDGIYHIKIPLVSKEHVCLIDNYTVFGDVIYDVEPGYRQERIKVLGYRTSDWNGSLNIPGFIYDDAKITEWEAWKDYSIGDLVKYKEFYYSAKYKTPGTATFNDDDWARLESAPKAGLYANFDYKTNQFADFYDLDSDNFDSEQQRLAQHLIGYQKRKYLENIINDDVSQYKFYQGFISDKGTKNALTKLFDALASADKDSLEFYEEWAVKDGQYGASESFDEVEYKLEEKEFNLKPQPILLTDTITGQETDLIYRIPSYKTYLKSKNYNHKPFPTKLITKGYTKDSGYVNPEDVDFIVGQYSNLLTLDIDKILNGQYVWVGNVDFNWDVYQYVDTNYRIDSIITGTDSFTLKLNETPNDVKVGDILGIVQITSTSFDPLDSSQEATFSTSTAKGFYKVKSVMLDKIEFESDDPPADFENADGIVTKFESVRASDIANANQIAERAMELGFKIWIDDEGDQKWTVIENTGKFDLLDSIGSKQTTPTNFGVAKSVDERNVILAIGAPEEENGKVYIYRRASESTNWSLFQVLLPSPDICASGQKFGSSIELSKDGKYIIIGSPNASNVKTPFKGAYSGPTDYSAGDIVLYNQAYWSADNAIEGSEANIQFNSFANYNQIIYELNLDEERSEDIDSLLAGNFPFTNVTADHFLVRIPTAMYQGIGLEDEIFLHWNKLTNANQTQIDLVEREPFDGTIPYISKEYLETNHTVAEKIDTVLYVDQITNPPQIGDTVTTQGATATVVYTFSVGGSMTIYVNNTNGVFPLSNSLFIEGNDFIGEYESVAPSDTTFDASTQLGGYVFIRSSNPYTVGTTNKDSGRGLVVKNVVTDSSASNNYYYNSLDTATATVDSLNTDHSLVQVLSFQGAPGPGGSNDAFTPPYWVARAPKALTDTLSAGDTLEFYWNKLKKTVTTLTVTNPVTVVAGEILSQDNTAATCIVFESTTASNTIKVENVTGSFSTVDFLSGSQSGPLLVRPNSAPIVGTLIQPSNINLDYSLTNKEQTVFDVWDGYIDFRVTKTLDGEPFEPIPRYQYIGSNWVDTGAGQIVRDVTTGAEAEVMFYKRNFRDITIYVKNVTGSWSKGDLFGDNAEIEFLALPGTQGFSGPNPDVFGRPDIYTINRVMGQIQQTSLGYTPAGIGKLIVFDAATTINVPTTFEIKDVEYWMYKSSTVLGIPRLANVPGRDNLDWTEVYKVSATTNGNASSYTNEGMVSIFERFGQQYSVIHNIVSPQRKTNHYFGSKVALKLKDNLYRAFIGALDLVSTSNPGKIYFIKNGTENNNIYNWDYAKNKKFQGQFDPARNYYIGDIVYNDGSLFNATTNLTPGPFDATFWDSTDDMIDYVGFIPNDTGLKVINDSSLDSTIELTNINDFGTDFDISNDGEVLITNVTYTDKPNVVAVYRNNNGQFGWSADINAPSTGAQFGKSIAIDTVGASIAISDPFDDSVKNDQGRVFLYRYNSKENSWYLDQTISSPNNELGELFGNKIDYDGLHLVVNGKTSDNVKSTTFDNNSLTLDNDFTRLELKTIDSGTVYVYENIGNKLVYAHNLNYEKIINDVEYPVVDFGENLKVDKSHIYIGLPALASSPTEYGNVVNYRLPSNKIYTKIRETKETVDLDKIKRIILYNTKTKSLIKYLDYIDPIQGKVAGVAEENLSFKLYYDPASYNTASDTSVILDSSNSWHKNHVGELWWDLTNAKFYNAYQGDVSFSANNWSTLFNSNTIDVYEWVESKYLPSEWNNLADTDEGLAEGISGTARYSDTAYTLKRQYDEISQTFSNLYYFWVKDKKTIPDVEGRTLNANDVANLIANPASNNYEFVGLFTNDSFAAYNIEKYLENNDVAIGIQWWNIDKKDINIHNQYQIITDGLPSSKPNRDIEAKWLDSLVGYDLYGRLVPDPSLGEKQKYGTLNAPRQSWFVNRLEALKQFIERTNSVLEKELIVDSKSLLTLSTQDPAPSSVTNIFDTSVDTKADLNLLGVAKAKQATMSVTVKDGKIVEALILDPGRGYLTVPTYTISGIGSGAEFKFTLNSVGSISNVEIVNAGVNYDENTSVTIRKFTVLVNADEEIQGKWALYERNFATSDWNRFKSQSYNTTLYWDYKDWYLTGYGPYTEPKFTVDLSYELSGLDDKINDIVKINNIGSGGWLLLRKIDNQADVDYTVNYQTVGRQNGTIYFKQSLYNTNISFDGFDEISFDTKFYDSLPTTETRIIAGAIKNDLFIEELEVEYNKLFFASLRYILSEQLYVDWMFKTSFIKAKHNVGSLRKDLTFNNDNLPSYQDYIDEVKPFKTKLREYVSGYEKLEQSSNLTTDFDLPPKYDETSEKITTSNLKVVNGQIQGSDYNTTVYPGKNWKDNLGFIVKEIKIADGGSGYTSPPVLQITGGGGSGATAITKLGAGGKITSIEVTNPGSGYIIAPTLTIQGSLSDNGTPAKLSLIIGQSLARSIHTIMKLDRVSGKYFITTLDETENFVGSGSKYIYDLQWPLDMASANINVSVAGEELLTSEYKYENVLDRTKGYDRYKGRITLTMPAAVSSAIVVTYKKDVNLLQAQDRINLIYDPQTGQYDKDLSQLMDGIDYGGVEVKSFDFGGPSGWDTAPWYTGSYDTYDTTYEDEKFLKKYVELTFSQNVTVSKSSTLVQDNTGATGIVIADVTNSNKVVLQTTFDMAFNTSDEIRSDDSTLILASNEQSKPSSVSNYVELTNNLENNVLYNFYKNDIRLDDPDWTDDSTQFANPNAVMRSIEGDGTTARVILPNISYASTDNVVVRKSTSDGSFLPTNIDYDTVIKGGDLNYSNARGLNPEDINVDGDGFTTPTNSKGPDELVPGWVQDTVDIKVFERPTNGASHIISRNYTGDGTTTEFDIGTAPITESSTFVKVDNNIKKITTDYTIDFTNNKIKFTSAPANNSRINFVTLEYSGSNILDIDEFTGDGSTVDFLTNIRWTDDLSSLITIDGKQIEHVLIKSDNSFIAPGNVVISFAEPPAIDKVIRYAIFEGTVQNYSSVVLDTFVHDGSTSTFTLTQSPFTQEPHEWFTIVKLRNKILKAGYSERFKVTDTREYRLRLYQVPLGSVSNNQLRVFLNNTELTFIDDWTFSAADAFDPLLPLDQQTGSTIVLNDNVGSTGDVLKVYITGYDDSTQDSGGEYKFGYFDTNGDFIKTPGVLHLGPDYSEGDVVEVYQFSNHDSQGIDRQSFDVVEKTDLSPGALVGAQQYQVDGSTAEINLVTALEPERQYAIFQNNTRIDDPNFDGSTVVANVNAKCKTVEVESTTNVLNISDLGIITNAGDVIKIVEVGADIVPDESTDDWYESRLLRNGVVPLNSPAVDDQYVWVVRNGFLLDPSVDYYLSEDKLSVKILGGLDENDTVETIHFSNTLLRNKYGWRQFKDILNRTHYKIINGKEDIRLTHDLHWYSKEIILENTESLPKPNSQDGKPGVIFVEGERIEYFKKDKLKLTQLRRGTLGTGVKNTYTDGTEIYNQSSTFTMPYKDETLTTVFTATGDSSGFTLDFDPTTLAEQYSATTGRTIDATAFFEVFVAGKRLRKTTLQSYELNTSARTTYATTDEKISQDSPEGDVTLPAEFTIRDRNELVLLQEPAENVKVIVVRRVGQTWNDAGKTLSNSDTNVARFLRSTQVDLPR